MFLAKLKLAVGAVMVVAALGAGGVAYQVSGPRAVRAAPEGKPASELEALKKENELLRFNLQVILEKARAQEAELRSLKGQAKAAKQWAEIGFVVPTEVEISVPKQVEISAKHLKTYVNLTTEVVKPDPARQVEAALKAYREAKDAQAKRKAADALEQAVKKLKPQGGN